MRARGLYPIVDAAALRARGIAIVDFAREVVAARPPLLQLRAKELGARETLDLLRALLPLCRAAGTLLFTNDRPDLAVLAGADGVHVGQSDLSVADVRSFAPSLKVGTSTHDAAELEAALAARPDYVAFGPVGATALGDGSTAPLELFAWWAEMIEVPVVAEGGLTPELARSLAGAADFLALGPELWTAPDGPAAALGRFAAAAAG